nr:DinB family protein [Saprospiraceae bacterium]
METLEKAWSDYNRSQKKLLELVSQFSPEKRDVRPEQDKWSVLEIVLHLIKADEQALVYGRKKLTAGKVKQVRSLERIKRKVLLLALKLPFKYKAPRMVTPTVDDRLPYEGAIKKWNEIRSELKELCLTLDPDLLQKGVFKHPYSGKMTPAEFIVFLNSHLDRHRLQIKNRLKSL